MVKWSNQKCQWVVEGYGLTFVGADEEEEEKKKKKKKKR
jgi:hypothetical protein